MMLEINGILYEMDQEKFEKVLLAAEDTFINEHAIYAIEKGDLTLMMKSKYTNKNKMFKVIAEYKKEGFKVHYCKKEAS